MPQSLMLTQDSLIVPVPLVNKDSSSWACAGPAPVQHSCAALLQRCS